MNIAILLAAGSSTRAGQDKLWADVFGRPLWSLAVETFATHPQIDRVILVVRPGERFEPLPAKVHMVEGGKTRMDSFKAGLAAAGPLSKDDVILDHNAANPKVTIKEISAVIAAAQEHGAAAVAHPAVDTVIQVDDEGFARANVARNNLRLMQTPQAVRGDVLAGLALSDATDLTTALLEHTPVKILPADPRNKKITFATDLESLRAQTYLGEDSHRFSFEGALTLGGLIVPDCPAMLANSDGDVILHAIGRALAQAQGHRFSEVADPLCESGDRKSTHYLDPLMEGLTLLEASINIEGARPHIDSLPLAASLAKLLRMPEDRIHISAMSGEDLTPFGRGEGLRCSTVLTIVKKGIE